MDRYKTKPVEIEAMTRNHMLIIGVMGEVYPCKLEAFRGKYERVD